MSKIQRLLGTVVALGAVLALAIAVTTASAAGSKSAGKKDSGTAYFSIVRTVGKTEYFAGYGIDKLFGVGAATYRATLTSATSGVINVTVNSLTLWTKTGSLSGTASAKENLATGAITDGHISLTKGTGAQKGHTFVGTFSGGGSTTANQFHYTYTATYK